MVEELVARGLEEYQSYQFSVQLANGAGVGPAEDMLTECVRTLEAGELRFNVCRLLKFGTEVSIIERCLY